MKHIYFLFLACLSLNSFSQTPQGISYQGVLRNLDGSIISDAAITITFRIHDSSPDGIVVYEENHTTTTSSNGLVTLTVGMGNAVTGVFSQISWGAGNKYLQVLMNNGSGEIDLGTQQMMSVPYALYAEDVNVNISSTGDTLTLGNSSVIVPGISNSTNGTNYQYTQGAGVTDIDGNFYPSVIINGKEWMAENLRTTRYSNGIPINYVTNWSMGASGYTYYNLDTLLRNEYGHLYSSNCINDVISNSDQNVCPAGWHVASKLDFIHLLCSIDPHLTMSSNIDFEAYYSNMDYSLYSFGENTATQVIAEQMNRFGFNLKNGGIVYGYSYLPNQYDGINTGTVFWSTKRLPQSGNVFPWVLAANNTTFNSASGLAITTTTGLNSVNLGFYVRCVKD